MIRTEICGTSILYTSYEVIQVYFEMMDFPVAPTIKNLSAMLETWLRPLGWENSLEKGMATHSSILFFFFFTPVFLSGESHGRGAWWATVMGSERLGHDWMTTTTTNLKWHCTGKCACTHKHSHTCAHTHTLRLTFCSLLNDHFSLKRKLYRLDTEMYNSILGWMWSHLLHIFIFKPLRIVWWMPGNHFKGVTTLNCFT